MMALRILDLAWPDDNRDDVPEEPGEQWWPGSWRAPSAFAKQRWFITPPKKLDPAVGPSLLRHFSTDAALQEKYRLFVASTVHYTIEAVGSRQLCRCHELCRSMVDAGLPSKSYLAGGARGVACKTTGWRETTYACRYGSSVEQLV